MDSQQVGDYIAEQIKAGHSEPVLRQHLLQHGWSQAAVDRAFEQYHRANTYRADTSDIKPVKRRRTYRPRWPKARMAKIVAVGMAVITLAAGGYTVLSRDKQALPEVTAKPLSYQAKQAIDVATIAGAVVQYTVTAEATPTTASVAASGNLLLCSPNCDLTTPEVNQLIVYKPANVFIKPYAQGLAAPDKQTLYLVPAAKCASTSAIGTPSDKPHAMVLLYARVTNDGTVPRCITLG